ncbi:MAG: ATP-binding protein [Planctomycetota bacterium]
MTTADRSESPSAETRTPDVILHDVRNLLTTIAALTVRARSSLEGDVSPNAQQATQLITQLGKAVGNAMNLARSNGRAPEGEAEVHLVNFVEDHIPALGAIVGGSDHLDVRFAERLGSTSVRIDATDLLRILVNVLRNAEEASEQGSKIELEFDVLDTDRPLDARPAELPPNHYAVVRVSDRGEGVDRSLVDLVIEPGVSSKAPGRGRGLHVVAQLLREASGGLRIEPRDGGGSTIELFVPATG